jgi:hypothetical protein
VLKTVREKIQDVPLSRRQPAELRGGSCALLVILVALAIDADRVQENVDQHVVIDRLLQKIDRAILQSRACGVHIAMRGQHDDRQRDTALLQDALQLKAAHALHFQVRQQTAPP